MHPLSTIRNYLLLLALLAAGVEAELHAQSQSGASTNSPFDLMQKKWNLVLDKELLKAAQANDAQAQYYYWKRETDKALQEQNQLWGQYLELKNKLPPDEQKSLWGRWKSTTDEELTEAARRGDVEANIV